MLKVYPDYYKDFSCIAEKCRHNCCIGWEIDIDEKTKRLYDKTDGELGKLLSENISKDNPPHFVLRKDGRCPFLNDKNLCDIILGIGEESLCDICREHPRFTNELPGRLEIGIGLACEEAARIVLSKKEKTTLQKDGEEIKQDELISLRDEIIAVLQNREKGIFERLCDAVARFDILPFEVDIFSWIDFLLSLECLDEKWREMLGKLSTAIEESRLDLVGYSEYIRQQMSEYEQFAVYLMYRYFANAYDVPDAAIRMCFVKLATTLLYYLGALVFSENGEVSFGERVEVARMFSAEIEYSEENIEKIFDEIAFVV